MTTSSGETLVEFDSAGLTLPGRPSLREVDLTLRAGELTVAFGSDGSGVRELLRLAVGVARPTSGSVTLKGVDLASAPRSELCRLRRLAGFVLRDGGLMSNMTLAQNIELPLRYHTRLSGEAIRRRAEDLLRHFKLEEVRDRRPAAVDLLARQCVLFARALAMDPELMLYDHPIEGHDPVTSAWLLGFVREACTPQRASLVATCDIRYYLGIADHCLMMEGGRIVWRGEPHDLIATDQPAVRRFLDAGPQRPIA